MTTNETTKDKKDPEYPISFAVEVKAAEAQLRDHFEATEATIDTGGGETTLRLEFRGFEGLSPALEKVGTVARVLNASVDVDHVHCGVNADGAYDPNTGEHDGRPAGWVNATLEE